MCQFCINFWYQFGLNGALKRFATDSPPPAHGLRSSERASPSSPILWSHDLLHYDLNRQPYNLEPRFSIQLAVKPSSFGSTSRTLGKRTGGRLLNPRMNKADLEIWPIVFARWSLRGSQWKLNEEFSLEVSQKNLILWTFWECHSGQDDRIWTW